MIDDVTDIFIESFNVSILPYLLLILGAGYTILWLRYWYDKKVDVFYERKSFDKAMQTLIYGGILFVLTMWVTETPFKETISISGSFILIQFSIGMYELLFLVGIDRISSKITSHRKLKRSKFNKFKPTIFSKIRELCCQLTRHFSCR